MKRALLIGLLAAAILPINASAGSNVINTIAGTTNGFSGDTGAASLAQLDRPADVAPTPDGGYLIADQDNFRVRRVSKTGTITTAAGNGTSGFSGDGGPATAAQLSNSVSGLSAFPDGSFLIADLANGRVRKVSAGGTITTVAGNGTVAFSDGGPATATGLSGVADVEALPDGGFLIADRGHGRVRRVSPGGTITTVAGNGTFCVITDPCGDGGPATSAQVNNPSSLSAAPGGGFVIGDGGARQVRRVSASGTITRVIGTGGLCNGGAEPCNDGGPAATATVGDVGDVLALANGGVLFSDPSRNRVRYVSPFGIVTPFAGSPSGASGATGDGGVAGGALLASPIGLDLTDDGDLLIADFANDRIRRVDSDFPGALESAAQGPAGANAAAADGSAGPSGANGAQGAAGATGPAGTDGSVKCTVKRVKKAPKVKCTLSGKSAAAQVSTRLKRIRAGVYRLTVTVVERDGERTRTSQRVALR